MKSMKLITKIRLGFVATCACCVVICVIAIGLLQGGISVAAWSKEAIALQILVLMCMIISIIISNVAAHKIVMSFKKSLKQLGDIADNLSKGNSDIAVNNVVNAVAV